MTDGGRSSNRRGGRVNRLIQSALAELVPAKIKDARLVEGNIVGVTEVRATSDLAHAKVYVSVPTEGYVGENPGAYQHDVIAALRQRSGFLRGELGRRLRLRRVPELHFELDTTGSQVTRIETILGELAEEKGQSHG